MLNEQLFNNHPMSFAINALNYLTDPTCNVLSLLLYLSRSFGLLSFYRKRPTEEQIHFIGIGKRPEKKSFEQ